MVALGKRIFLTGIFCLCLLSLSTMVLAQNRPATAVTVSEDQSSFTMSNGIITARVLKRNGDLASLQFNGVEVFTDKSGHAGAYWSHDTTGGKQIISRITIDPKANSGERAEVSVKGISGGIKMGHGPGSAPDGDFPADIEIRYSLGRGETGVYTYCTFEHLPEYPGATMTEARFCAKLADYFDWMSVDAKRNKHYPATLREGDKYVYTTIQSENLAFGWSSTTKNVGFFLVNPTIEYLSGGPTKVEFLCHRDTTAVAAPCVLNYWRSSHYGGADVTVGPGEHWTKVIGPFFLYCNTGPDPIAMWQDARQQAVKEGAKWPYDWVSGVDYPRSNDRATVNGQLVLNDPLMPGAKLGGKLLVGLAHPTFAPPTTRPAGPGGPRQITWQTNAKHYQFWARSDASNGKFSIPDVRPGKYTLHAIADGVLGEYVKADVVIENGKAVELGQLTWTPVRRGKQLWDVGIPNRNASEFVNGDVYFKPEMPRLYATLFPNDVSYTIGKSDFSKDWYFAHLPHFDEAATEAAQGARRANAPATAPTVARGPTTGPAGRGARGPGGFGPPPAVGRATPFTVSFDLGSAPRGKATLRLAISGTQARAIEVAVNEKPAGTVDRLISDNAITRHAIQGIWYERELAFDASLMKQGNNKLTLTIPAGPINNGMIYDYLRLELDENTQTAAISAP